MLKYLFLALLLHSGFQIPHNLEINVIQISLEKEVLPPPSPRATTNFYDSITFSQLINHKIKHFLAPTFGAPNQTEKAAQTNTRSLSFGRTSWVTNGLGHIVPPWKPRELTLDVVSLMNEKELEYIRESSTVLYTTELEVGPAKIPIDFEISSASSDNILLSTACKNCTEKGESQLLPQERNCEPRGNASASNSSAHNCTGIAWIQVYELINQRSKFEFDYVLLDKISPRLHGGGVLSLLPNKNIVHGLFDADIVERKTFGIHFQNPSVSDDINFINFGGQIQAQGEELGMDTFPMKINKGHYLFLIDGIVLRKGGSREHSIFGLQDYDTFLDESNKYIAFPFNLLNSIRDFFVELGIYCYIDTDLRVGVFVCDRDSSHYPVISFVAGSKEIVMDPKIYGGTCEDRMGVTLCITNIAVSFTNKILLGEPFFINNYLLFDLDNKKISVTYPSSQSLVDWSIFDNTYVMIGIIILFAALIITVIWCLKEKAPAREFSPFLEDRPDKTDKAIKEDTKLQAQLHTTRDPREREIEMR